MKKFILSACLCAAAVCSFAGCASVNSPSEVSGVSKSVEEEKRTEVSNEKISEMISALSFRGLESDTSGYFKHIQRIKAGQPQMVSLNVSSEEQENYFYVHYGCGDENYVVVYDSDASGQQPKNAKGMLFYTTVISQDALMQCRSLQDIVSLENEETDVFYHHFTVGNTMIFSVLGYQPTGAVSYHLTDDGLYYVEYENNLFDSEQKLNMDCQIRKTGKCHDDAMQLIAEQCIV